MLGKKEDMLLTFKSLKIQYLSKPIACFAGLGLMGAIGIEPTANRVRAGRSTAELRTQPKQKIVVFA